MGHRRLGGVCMLVVDARINRGHTQWEGLGMDI